MEQEKAGKVLSLSDAQARRVLVTEKWIKATTKWASILPRDHISFAVSTPVENNQGYPLQFRCSWNTMVTGKYEYSLLWMSMRICSLDVGSHRKTPETVYERFWKNGSCRSLRVPDYVTDPNNAERTFRELLIRLHIDYRGVFPGAGQQWTLERGMVLDDVF